LVTALFGGIVAILDTGAVWLLGVPLALVWGLLSFITNFVPNIGFIIGLVPPALLDGGWGSMLAVIAVYCVLNLVIQTFIQPRFVGDAVGLGTTVAFLSLALWTYSLGGLGALLAVPMTLLVRAVLIDADPAAGWAVLFLGSTPKLSPDAGEKPGQEEKSVQEDKSGQEDKPKQTSTRDHHNKESPWTGSSKLFCC
jgi:AI-2 transport protein TqsA